MSSQTIIQQSIILDESPSSLLNGLPAKNFPVGLFDDTTIKRPVLICSTFLFDRVLNVSQVRHSLEELIKRDRWNKAGARSRRNVGSTILSENRAKTHAYLSQKQVA
jgi:hypothetical protein